MQLHKQHYCGLCKTIAARYSQKSRLFLNYDVAFLQELLWASKTDKQSYLKQPLLHCFILPKEQELSSLEIFFADINVFLAYCTIRDKIADGEGRHWNALNSVYREDFAYACENLKKAGFPVNGCLSLLQKQKSIESSATAFDSMLCAKPAAEVCALVFEFAASIAGIAKTSLYRQAGYSFGELVYVADALKDYSRDIKKKQFNPLFLFEGTDAQKIQNGRTLVVEKLASMKGCISDLEIPEEKKQYFQSVLQANVQPIVRNKDLAVNMRARKFHQFIFKHRIAWLSDRSKLVWRNLLSSDVSFLNKLNGTKSFIVLLVFIFISNRLAAQADVDLQTLFASQDCCQCCQCCDTCGNCCNGCQTCCDDCKNCCDSCGNNCNGCGECCKECEECNGACKECCAECGHSPLKHNECESCCGFCCCGSIALVLLIVGAVIGFVKLLMRSSKPSNVNRKQWRSVEQSDIQDSAFDSVAEGGIEAEEIPGFREDEVIIPRKYMYSKLKQLGLASSLLLFILVFYSIISDSSGSLAYLVASSVFSAVSALLFGLIPCGTRPYKYQFLFLLSVFTLIFYSLGILVAIFKVLLS